MLSIFLIKHYIFINVQLAHCIPRVDVGGGVPHPRTIRLSSEGSCLAAGIVLALTLLHAIPSPAHLTGRVEAIVPGAREGPVVFANPLSLRVQVGGTTEVFFGRCSGALSVGAPVP